MARLGDKAKLLNYLAETPIVSFACKKIGLNRTTFYRWYKDNKDFKDQVDKILEIGRMRINDMAESVLIKKVNSDDTRCTIFWLRNNHPKYKLPPSDGFGFSNHRHDLAPGEMCRHCGYLEPRIEEYKDDKKHQRDMTDEELSKELYKRLRSINTRKQSEPEIRKIINDFVRNNNIKVEWKIVSGEKDIDDEKDSDHV